MNCRVCGETFEADNAMRRDCCAWGFVHLSCIEDIDLYECHACQKDPLRTGLEMCRLRSVVLHQPMEQLPPCRELSNQVLLYGQPVPIGEEIPAARAVCLANRSLDRWAEMIHSALREITSKWEEGVAITDFKVGATRFDGMHLLDRKTLGRHWTKKHTEVLEVMMKSVFDSVSHWAGCPAGEFNRVTVDSYKLDKIVEFTVQFRCEQFTRSKEALNDPTRPFATKSVYKRLGFWDCLICMSGLTLVPLFGRPRAQRIDICKV